MKLSFSLSSKPTQKPGRTVQNFVEEKSRKEVAGQSKLEYVTEYDPSVSPSNNGNTVISYNQQEQRPTKKMKNLDLPLRASSQLPFEVDATPSNQEHNTVTYGLNLRKKSEENVDCGGLESSSRSFMINTSRDDSWKLLPEDPGIEEFDDVPVENYGAALLGGLGWHEGQGIGRRTRNDIKVREYNRLAGKNGLGYTPDLPVDNSGKKEKKEKKKENGFKKGRERSEPWLRSNIRVRIISKTLKGGKFYLKKGVVVDVVGPLVCDISMDGTRELVQGVGQDILETALPRQGGRVLVLSGKYNGVLGNLVERRLDEDTGVVEDVDDRVLFTVRLDQMAEYVGDPSLLDYS